MKFRSVNSFIKKLNHICQKYDGLQNIAIQLSRYNSYLEKDEKYRLASVRTFNVPKLEIVTIQNVSNYGDFPECWKWMDELDMNLDLYSMIKLFDIDFIDIRSWNSILPRKEKKQ